MESGRTPGNLTTVPIAAYTGGEDVPHHSWNVGFVLGALPLKEVDDDAKTSSAHFRIVADLVLVKVQETNN